MRPLRNKDASFRPASNRSGSLAFERTPAAQIRSHLAGTKFQTAAFWRWAVGRIAGNIVLSRDYFVSQVASLLKFAKETTNPQLAAV